MKNGKRPTGLLLAFLFCLLGSALQAQPVPVSSEQLLADGFKRYGVESGVIEYEFKGAASGKETVSWDRWGWREHTYTYKNTQLFGGIQNVQGGSILDGNYVTSFSSGNTIASYFSEGKICQALSRMTRANPELVGLQVWLDQGAKKKGRETIKGKSCDKYEVPNTRTTVWIWEGVVLKLERPLGNKIFTMIATDIDLDKKVKPKKFELPDNYSIDGYGEK